VLKQGVGQPQVALAVFKVDGVYLVGHGAAAHLARDRALPDSVGIGVGWWCCWVVLETGVGSAGNTNNKHTAHTPRHSSQPPKEDTYLK
jgi:hypothetical protein